MVETGRYCIQVLQNIDLLYQLSQNLVNIQPLTSYIVPNAALNSSSVELVSTDMTITQNEFYNNINTLSGSIYKLNNLNSIPGGVFYENRLSCTSMIDTGTLTCTTLNCTSEVDTGTLSCVGLTNTGNYTLPSSTFTTPTSGQL